MPDPTPQELNATVARWLGWSDLRFDDHGFGTGIAPGDTVRTRVPDFAGDLNTWEEVLDKLRTTYQIWEPWIDKIYLAADVSNRGNPGKHAFMRVMQLTALQRARALVRVIGGGE